MQFEVHLQHVGSSFGTKIIAILVVHTLANIAHVLHRCCQRRILSTCSLMQSSQNQAHHEVVKTNLELEERQMLQGQQRQ